MTTPDPERLAREVAHLGNGPQAELRRLDPRRADTWPTVFWRLYAEQIEPHLPSPVEEERQRTWAAVMSGMAHLAHHDTHPGKALALHQYSDLRLNRLLSAGGTRLIDEFRAAVRFLAAKRQPGIDWTQLAQLITHYPDSPAGDSVRRHLAGAYYRTLAQAQKD